MLEIEVLGPGCTKCDDTFNKVKAVLDELKLEAELTKVTDVFEIIDRKVSFTPALIIDGKLVFQGQVPTTEQIREVLRDRVSVKEEQ